MRGVSIFSSGSCKKAEVFPECKNFFLFSSNFHNAPVIRHIYKVCASQLSLFWSLFWVNHWIGRPHNTQCLFFSSSGAQTPTFSTSSGLCDAEEGMQRDDTIPTYGLWVHPLRVGEWMLNIKRRMSDKKTSASQCSHRRSLKSSTPTQCVAIVDISQ